MSGHWSLLSITDLHYEAAETNLLDDAKELEYWQYRENVFPDFNRIVDPGLAGQKFDLVAIGGDITTHGKKEGLTAFRHQMLPFLVPPLVPSRQAVCIVPGNHDVTWKLDPYAAGSFRRKFADFRELVDESRTTSCLFPDGELTRRSDTSLSLSAPKYGPIYDDADRKVLALCINSAIRCGELNMQMLEALDGPAEKALKALQRTMPRGAATANLAKLREALPKYLIRDVAHVTQAQRNQLADLLSACQQRHAADWAGYLRVAIVHHHLIHFPGQTLEHKGYELMVDSADVLSLLADFDFDLVLTGHKHQPYVEAHSVGGKEILMVGGPTVGGFAPDNSFRGLRRIEVFDRGDHRTFQITDIPNSTGRGNVVAKIAKASPKIEIDCRRPPDLALERHAKEAGFSYREVASITAIGADGDARRIVECEDLAVTAEGHPRSRAHKIAFPSTSGYLDVLRASGRGFTIRVPSLQDGQQHGSAVLEFDEAIGSPAPASYTYQWFAVNAFALDKLQFNYKYGKDPGRLNDIEFTHFQTDDPVRELTVIVRFPPGFQLEHPPRVRIAQVDANQPDSREWEIDPEVQSQLSTGYAMRFYESLNIAALRVPFPQPGLSYGIQWEVPDAASGRTAFGPEMNEILTRMAAKHVTKPQHALLMETLVRILVAMRRSLIANWFGPADASLMYFDRQRSLPVVVAAEERRDTTGKYDRKELVYSATLHYGEGIAGRAFKANQPRVYVSPGDMDLEEPAYYKAIPGAPAHKILLCLPVHVPVDKQSFYNQPGIYASHSPYGVISLGSENGTCPLSAFRLPEKIPTLLQFQHDVNEILYAALKSAFLDGQG